VDLIARFDRRSRHELDDVARAQGERLAVGEHDLPRGFRVRGGGSEQR